VNTIAGWYDTLALDSNSNSNVSGGGFNTISVGAGAIATIGDSRDTVAAASGDTLSLSGAFYTKIEVGSLGGGTLTIANYMPTNSDVIDLLGGVGGYNSASAAAHALVSDGNGGSLLSLGAAGTVDFQAVAPSRLSAGNFAIG
jgi:hypothetical protein